MRYQEFLSTTTFTPSAKLIANGGQCMALVVGGGAGSADSAGNRLAGGGGSVRCVPLTITTAQTVTVGAGGTAGGGAGGASSIGALVSAPGGRAFGFYPGLPGGGHGSFQGGGVYSPGMGSYGYGMGGLIVPDSSSPPPANSGNGGHAFAGSHYAGASGYVRIWWSE